MKSNRKTLAAAVTAALALTVCAPSPAQALSVHLNGAPVTDNQEAVRALVGAASTIAKSGATFSYAGYQVVYDPRSLGEEIGSAFAPQQSDDAVRFQTGRTADGRKVVTPAVGRFTSGYGPRWGRIHNGIDIANSIGTPIYAVMDGTVINAGPAQGFGNWVVIKHDGGEVSVYGHMREYNVRVGQRVTAGEQIAKIGNEGQSTGPHLHFEIKPDGHKQVDPVPWFKANGITI